MLMHRTEKIRIEATGPSAGGCSISTAPPDLNKIQYYKRYTLVQTEVANAGENLLFA